MARAMYQSTVLVGTNKTGALKADADGYYDLVLGAFDYYNSCGDYYPLDPVKEMFEESGSLMRRLRNAALRGEYGHPKRVPGQSMREFMSRVMEIRETNVCCHIAEVMIDNQAFSDNKGRKIPVVVGRVKPSGPMGQFLAASLENPKENVCFSIRSLTEDVDDGRGGYTKLIRHIITWDYVNEPGINLATKFNSPSLESIDSCSFDLVQLELAKKLALSSGASMESDYVSQINEALSSFRNHGKKIQTPGLILPPSARW